MGFNNVYENKYIRIFDYVHTFRTYVIKILFSQLVKFCRGSTPNIGLFIR
jgi:hypothetical protein